MDFGWIRFIYNRKFIVDNELWFPSLIQHEDPVWFVNVMSKAKKFYAIPEIVYRYRCGYKTQQLTQKRVDDGIKGVIMNLVVAEKNGWRILEKWSIEQLAYYIKCSPGIQDPIQQLQKENERLRIKLKKKEQHLEEIQKSRALKVGLIVTAPVRKLKAMRKTIS